MSNKESNNERQKSPSGGQEMPIEEREKAESVASESDVTEDDAVRKEVWKEDSDQETIAELEAQLEDLRNSYLRKIADLENFKKRTERERVHLLESAKITALEDFLPVYEDLQRTIAAIEDSSVTNVSQIEDGVKMIESKFREVLSRHNVESIDETGVPFDVNLHDALLRQKPEDETVESDTVLKILENGYKMGDRTIRHAKVIVSE